MAKIIITIIFGQLCNSDYLTRLLIGDMIKVLVHDLSNIKYQ